jgi:hypothetical protein
MTPHRLTKCLTAGALAVTLAIAPPALVFHGGGGGFGGGMHSGGFGGAGCMVVVLEEGYMPWEAAGCTSVDGWRPTLLRVEFVGF